MNTLAKARERRKQLYNEKYRSQLDFERKIKEAEEEYERLVKETLPQPIWGFEVRFETAEECRWRSDVAKETEVIRVARVITNLEDIREAFSEAKARIPGIEHHNEGISYYRVNKVLLTTGGGTDVIPSPQIVEDNEWDAMKLGLVPERIQRRN